MSSREFLTEVSEPGGFEYRLDLKKLIEIDLHAFSKKIPGPTKQNEYENTISTKLRLSITGDFHTFENRNRYIFGEDYLFYKENDKGFSITYQILKKTQKIDLTRLVITKVDNITGFKSQILFRVPARIRVPNIENFGVEVTKEENILVFYLLDLISRSDLYTLKKKDFIKKEEVLTEEQLKGTASDIIELSRKQEESGKVVIILELGNLDYKDYLENFKSSAEKFHVNLVFHKWLNLQNMNIDFYEFSRDKLLILDGKSGGSVQTKIGAKFDSSRDERKRNLIKKDLDIVDFFLSR